MRGVGIGVLVELLVKSLDGGFNSLMLVQQFPGQETSTVIVCSSASLNTAACCLHLCYTKEDAGLSIVLAN